MVGKLMITHEDYFNRINGYKNLAAGWVEGEPSESISPEAIDNAYHLVEQTVPEAVEEDGLAFPTLPTMFAVATGASFSNGTTDLMFSLSNA